MRKLSLLCFVIINIHLIAFAKSTTSVSDASISKKIIQNSTYGFWENKGQVCDQNGNLRPDVLYLLDSRGFKIHLKKNSFSYELYSFETMPQEDKARDSFSIGLPGKFIKQEKIIVKSHRIDIELLGANQNPVVTHEEQSEDYNNYYLAHTPEEGVTYVHHYGKVIYHAIYKNIDLIFYRRTLDGNVKYDFIVHPGGNPYNIKLKINGAEQLRLTENANLQISTSQGTIDEQKPYCYQAGNTVIASKYYLDKDILSFIIDKSHIDKTKNLIIDPDLLWATYYGGSGVEAGYGITVDSYNNIITCGVTRSTSSIATIGAHQINYSGGWDAYITKFNNNGVRQWGTYYGGTGDDAVHKVITDVNNNILIIGNTDSQNSISTQGSYQEAYGGSGDAYIVKLNSNGIRQWGTYYGGTSYEYAYDISNTGNNEFIITGSTGSTNAISSIGAHQEIYGGDGDAYIAKFNSNGARLLGTYYGGSSIDFGVGLSVDDSNNLIFTGCTNSSSAIATTGAYQETFSGGTYDAFVVKFNTNGTRQWGTYYGGSNEDYGYGIAVDDVNNIIITGYTSSTNGFSTSGAHQETYGGGSCDAYLAKFSSSGVRQWATYYGGSGSDMVGDNIQASEIALDNFNNIIITGSTSSTNAISTTGAYQESMGGEWDAFIAKFNSGGTRIKGSYFGGYNQDGALGIVLDGNSNIIITGFTLSTNAIATTGSHQTTLGGSYDAFIAKFWFCTASAISSLAAKYLKNVICSNSLFDSLWVKNTGDCDLKITKSTFSGSNSSDFQLVQPSNWPQTVATGDSIRVIIKFTPTGTGSKSAKLNLENNSADNPWVIDLSARKDSIAFNLNSAVGDTLIIDFGTFCPGTTKDTSFTIRNTSTVPTTINFGGVLNPYIISPGTYLNYLIPYDTELFRQDLIDIKRINAINETKHKSNIGPGK